MKIEMLYPEVCNLFGDISNIKYLKKMFARCRNNKNRNKF